MNLEILIVEDNKDSARILKEILENEGHNPYCVENKNEAIKYINQHPYDLDLMILDLYIPAKEWDNPEGENGFEVLSYVKKEFPTIEVIIMTAFDDLKYAIRGIKEGAYDFLTKPLKLDLLMDRLDKLSSSIIKDWKILELREKENHFSGIIGESKAIKKILLEVCTIAESTLPVLIEGETGTGKELIARAIHQISNRKKDIFIAVNCAVIPETLMESELFGHEKGAFTTAVTRYNGKFEQAHEGTLFLDEIGEMKPDLQVKLLRVLEEKEITRVGGNRNIKIDVRIISATNREITKMVKNGELRSDLFYRLNNIRIKLPALRDRAEDIPMLADYFLRKYCEEIGLPEKSLSSGAIEQLMTHNWPGNIRELKSLIEKIVVCNKDKRIINPSDIEIDGSVPNCSWRELDDLNNLTLKEAKREFEKRYLKNLLKSIKSQAEGARRAGIDRSNFNKLMKKHGLHDY